MSLHTNKRTAKICNG